MMFNYLYKKFNNFCKVKHKKIYICLFNKNYICHHFCFFIVCAQKLNSIYQRATKYNKIE